VAPTPPLFATVPCLWPGETITCVASGWSLTPTDLAAIRGQTRVIVVNDCYRLAPWADVLYAADAPWWQRQQHVPDDCLPDRLYTLDSISKEYRPSVNVLRYMRGQGLAAQPDRLISGGHSGYQAIGLAAHLVGDGGTILLLGYDCQLGPRGETHCPLLPVPSDVVDRRYRYRRKYGLWRTTYDDLVEPLAARRISILNCSRRTAVTAFTRVSLSSALIACR